MFVYLLSKTSAIGVENMTVDICHHITYCVTGVALYTLYIAAAYFQFNACTAVAQRMKDDRAEIKVSVEVFQFAVNLPRFIRTAIILCNDQIVVLIFIGKVTLQELLI